MKSIIQVSTSCLLIFFTFLPSSFAQIIIPRKPANYVSDKAGIIKDRIEDKLNKYLSELDKIASSQMVIFTINNLKGESIEQLSATTYKKWELGQKDKDRGILLLISLQDRKWRFEVGNGLVSVLPGDFLGNIGKKYLVPYFRKGDCSTGILAATLANICEIAKNLKVETSWMRKQRYQQEIAKKEIRDRYEKFIKKNNIIEWPSMDSLSINPFVYQGKSVAMVSTLSTMVTATQGIFEADGEYFVVSYIPKGLFKTKEKVIIAGRVLGKTEIKIGLSLLVPHLRYSGVHFCKDWKCSDIIPNNHIIKTDCNLAIKNILNNR